MSTAQLSEFAKVDSTLPDKVLQLSEKELGRKFTYAIAALIVGLCFALAVLGVFAYLVLHGYPRSAAGLLSLGALGLVGGFTRSRL